jgi:hypothetical protein
MLAVVDDYTRECLAIEAANGLRSENVLHRLADLFVRPDVGRGAASKATEIRRPWKPREAA